MRISDAIPTMGTNLCQEVGPQRTEEMKSICEKINRVAGQKISEVMDNGTTNVYSGRVFSYGDPGGW